MKWSKTAFLATVWLVGAGLGFIVVYYLRPDGEGVNIGLFIVMAAVCLVTILGLLDE